MTGRMQDYQLDTSTSSEDTLLDSKWLNEAGGYSQSKELEDCRAALLNYKILDIKYSKLLRLFSESTKQLGETHERVMQVREEKDAEIQELKQRVRELEAATPNSYLQHQHSSEDLFSHGQQSGCITPNFNSAFMYHFGGSGGTEAATQTDPHTYSEPQDAADNPTNKEQEDTLFQILITEPNLADQVPEMTERIFDYAMELDSNHLRVHKHTKTPTKNLDKIAQLEQQEQISHSVVSDSQHNISFNSHEISESYQEEDFDEHIYTPNTEARMFTFGQSMPMVNKLFTFQQPRIDTIKEVEEPAEDSPGERRKFSHDTPPPTELHESTIPMGNSLLAKRKFVLTKIEAKDGPLLASNSADVIESVQYGSPMKLNRATSQQPRSALLSSRRSKSELEEIRRQCSQLKKLTKTESARNLAKRSFSSTGKSGVDIIAEEFRLHNQNLRNLGHPCYMCIISALLLLLIFYLPV